MVVVVKLVVVKVVVYVVGKLVVIDVFSSVSVE